MKYVSIMFLGIVFLLQLTGCIVLPLPPMGVQIGREDIETLKPSLVKREPIHEVLGNPTAVVTDRYEIFDVGEERFNLFWLSVLPPWPQGDLYRIGRRSYRVLAEYGADDTLLDLLWEGTDEIPSEETLPSAAWDPIYGIVSASPDGRLLAQSPASNPFFGTPVVVLHDGWTGAPIARIDAIPGCQPFWIEPYFRPDSVTAFLSDGEHLASITEKGTLCIWNVDTRMGVLELVGGVGFWNLTSARSAAIIAAIDVKRSIVLWNGLTGSKISTIMPCKPENSCSLLTMALSDDGQLLATLQDRWARPEGRWKYERQGYVVRLWDVETGAELAAFELTNTPDLEPEPRRVAVSPDLRRLAVHAGDHVEIWRVNEMSGPAWRGGESFSQPIPWSAKLERVLILPPTHDGSIPGRSVAFSADGRRLAASSSSVRLWEVGIWREVWRAPTSYSQFFLTDDGRRIITRSNSWEVPDLAHLPIIRGHPDSG